jgi:LysR family hydrogen peroxide-inducible transcriptional activator
VEFSPIELRVLSGLASGKTLAAIGAELYLGEPSISKALHSAEQKAGLPLVALRGRRLHLTPEGCEVARLADSILVRFEELNWLLQTMRTGQGGPLRLAATPTPGNYVLPPIIDQFQRAFPDAQIRLEVMPAKDVPAALFSDDHDYCIGPQSVRREGLHAEWLYDDPVVFVVPSDDSDVPSDQRSAPTARGVTLIGPFAEQLWGVLFDELKRQGIEISRQVDIRAVEAVKQLVVAGVGIGVLLGSCVRAEIADGRLHTLPLLDTPMHQSFFLFRREGTVLPPLTASFRALLLRQLRPTLADLE